MQKNTLHNIFLAGITIKGIYGILELIAGFAFLLIRSKPIAEMTRTIFQNELVEDPKDFIANHVVQLSQNISINAMTFASLFLIMHGLINIGIFTALWYKKTWAYPIAAIMLSIFVIAQTIRFFITNSILLLSLTIIDIIIIILLRTEYKKQPKK